MNLIKPWELLRLLLLQYIFFSSTNRRQNLIPTALARPGNETDRLALLDIKAKITDDPAGIMSSWNESVDFCRWQGVTCGGRPRRVTVLDLRSLELFGSISPSIGNLSFLREIHLQNNSFAGEIPPELGNLRRLQILRLHNNSISGAIPANLSGCSALRRLNFAHNMISDNIPTQLGLLSMLQALILDNNLLTGIPSSLGNLSSLTSIGLSYNNLSGTIPETLARLTNLTFLGLGYNRLSGTIPAGLFNLSSLSNLHASYNDIHGTLPLTLGSTLPNLQTLAVGFNRFSGPIPGSLANISSLVNIFVPGNEFSGEFPVLGEKMPKLRRIVLSMNHLGTGDDAGDSSFISSLINATGLQQLFVDVNDLGGVLPESIGNFSVNLSRLDLSGNRRLFGSIPSGIGNLINLEIINMEGNQFSGNIPSEIGNLHNLKILNLFDNKLVGTIPSSLGNLSMLINFNLGKNDLQGTIPSTIGNCQDLVRLELGQNKLSGILPLEVTGISTLTILNLSRNNLTGSLPVEVGKLINLEELDVSDNILTGQIPGSLGSCVRMETLHLQGNYFQGPISSLLTTLRGVHSLDLSQNNLSGEIPDYLGDFRFLQTLNLSFNDFEGSVPTQGVFDNASAISVTGNRKLCGGVPELQLPVCNFNGSTEKKRRSRALKISISIVSALVGLSLCLLLFGWFLIRRKRPSPVPQVALLLKPSYQSLMEITDGFSSANLIGSGGFGSVYKGIWDADGQSGRTVLVAVKVLNLLHPQALKSFTAECETLRNIRHRNLVKLLTACSSVDYHGNEFKALVYEFMVNGNLEEWLHVNDRKNKEDAQPRKLNLLQRLNIAMDVAYALDYLHHGCQRPVVHCDLKPSNVLLDDELTAHVGDFGLSRFVPQATRNSSPDQTYSIGVRGSIGYTAPEYGMGSSVSTQGDVYSYGILLLEMFTGRRPTNETFAEGVSLRTFVEMTWPERVLEIADPTLVEHLDDDRFGRQKTEECLVSILGIGIACSLETPRKRLDMGDVLNELRLIQNSLLSTEFNSRER